jgi:hypothetical protein
VKRELDAELVKAAELGASGNGIIREVAEIDDDLKAALQAIERERQNSERERTGRISPRDAMPHQQSGAPNGPPEPTTEALHPQTDSETQRRDDPDRRTGDTSRSDPARQHIPRLEEMQRETEERHQRERDERER